MKENHIKCEREVNMRRITSLETKNIELQDTVNNKSKMIANSQRQINEKECEKPKTAKADIKEADQKEKEQLDKKKIYQDIDEETLKEYVKKAANLKASYVARSKKRF